jgi:hypothetical protein
MSAMRAVALIAGLAVGFGGAVERAAQAGSDRAAEATSGEGTGGEGTDYFGQDAPPEPEQISFRVDQPRTTRQRLLIGALLVGAAAAGGVGLLYHLDSRDKSNQVEAVGQHTGRVYSAEVDELRRGALASRDRAILGYAAGGLLLGGAGVAFYLTDPGDRRVTVGGDRPPPAPVVPVSVRFTPGGAVVRARWRF